MGVPKGAPQQPSPQQQQTDADFAAVRQRIGEGNAELAGFSGQLGELGGAGWDNFTGQQLGQFDVMANQRKQATLSQLGRQGLTGTASSNALGRQQLETDAAKGAMTGALGQQGLQFRQGILGQRADLSQTQTQNTLAPATLDVSQTAAQNAGKSPV